MASPWWCAVADERGVRAEAQSVSTGEPVARRSLHGDHDAAVVEWVDSGDHPRGPVAVQVVTRRERGGRDDDGVFGRPQRMVDGAVIVRSMLRHDRTLA
jgi:hypothetical protein